MPDAKIALVTVGTTKFDSLIRGVDSVDVLRAFKRRHFTKLVVQHGKGAYAVQHISPSPVRGLAVDARGNTGRQMALRYRLHEYLPNLGSVIEECSLVVSHCGAGSAFESLCLRVPLIVVPNPALMDNHQVELATLLDTEGYLVQCSPDTVTDALEKLDRAELRPYVPGHVAGIVRHIDALFP